MKRSKSSARIPLSKIVALVLFVVLPILGFYLGARYKPELTNGELSNLINKGELENKQLADDKTIFNFISNVRPYTKTSSSINFNCYDETSVPGEATINQVTEDLAKDQRVINTLCIDRTDNKILLVTTDESERSNNQLIELLEFSEPTRYTSQYVFQETEELDDRNFKLLDWLENGDIIFWLEDNNLNRQGSYLIKTYVYNPINLSSSFSAPQVVEYCDIGIAGGTSQRGIRRCNRFIESKTSSFFTQSLLP